jgi:hypothetical protein
VTVGNISDAERKERLLAALPQDGSSIGNGYISRQLNWSVETYVKVRNELVAEGKVVIGRGRGGVLRLTEPREKADAPATTDRPSRTRERTLYPSFRTSLEAWAESQGWSDFVIEQTSDQGSRRTGGRFTRPDFVVVGIKKYEYTPGVVRDIETFEVKPTGADIGAVFEAAAHSRFATKSYLVLEVEENEPTEDELGRIESECQRFGVGLITFLNPAAFDRWKYPVDPSRREPDPELVELFIKSQVGVKNQERIRKWMR